MGTNQRPLSREKSQIIIGALFFKIKGPVYCAEEKGPAFWAEETAVIVVPFFLAWRSLSSFGFHF